MFLLRGMERLLGLNLWMHAFRPGHTRRPASCQAREQIHPTMDLAASTAVTSRSTGGHGLMNGRMGGLQAESFCLVAAVHFSGCFREDGVARLPVFCLFISFFYLFHTSLCKLSTGWRANSAAVLHHPDLLLSHAGKAMCTHRESMQFKIRFCRNKMKIKLNLCRFALNPEHLNTF